MAPFETGSIMGRIRRLRGAMRTLLVVLLLSSAPIVASAATWLVLPGGGGDAPSIHAAVDSASNGDEILLGSGRHYVLAGSVSFDGKAITIRSVSGVPSDCVLDFPGTAGFKFTSGEGPSSVLADVQIEGTFGDYPYAAAVQCEDSSPTIRNLILTNNVAGLHLAFGGSPRVENVRVEWNGTPAIVAYESHPTITGCVLVSNATTASWGHEVGAISMYGSDALIENCLIEGNAGRGLAINGRSPTIRNSVITGNGDAAIWIWNSSPRLESCTITRNALYGVEVGSASTVELERTIVWGNCAADLSLSAGSIVNAGCTDLRRAFVVGSGTLVEGDHVIDVPPIFCGPKDCADVPVAGGDYTVDDDSAVVTGPCGLIGALAANCSIHVESASWGAIKALYR